MYTDGIPLMPFLNESYLTYQKKMSSSSNNPGGHFVLCLSCIQLYKIYILHKMDCADIMICCFQLDSESISTGKAAVASLLGGIGYFYGQSKISVPSNSNVSFTDLYVIVLIISNQLCLHQIHLKHTISI